MSTRVPPAVLTALTLERLPEAVDLHRQLLPHGFFVDLGPRFLTRYYRNYLESPHGFAMAAVDADGLAGALIGTLDHQSHTAWTTRSMWEFGRIGGLALLRDQRLLRRFLRTRARRYLRAVGRRTAAALRRRRGRTVANDHTGPALPRSPQIAVLSHLYVAPGHQGEGIGGRLVDAFLSAARAAGAERAELVTLTGAAGAGSFYAARGWQTLEQHADADGRTFATYVFQL